MASQPPSHELSKPLAKYFEQRRGAAPDQGQKQILYGNVDPFHALQGGLEQSID